MKGHIYTETHVSVFVVMDGEADNKWRCYAGPFRFEVALRRTTDKIFCRSYPSDGQAPELITCCSAHVSGATPTETH